MNKILLITHKADLDGAMPIILAKLVFDNVEDISVELNEVDETLKNKLNNINDYDKIYITDLNVSKEMAEMIDHNELYKNKIEIYDHHISAIELNKYSFDNVVVEKDNKKECGTSLFHKHLLSISNKEILKKDSLVQLVELTRLIDTWEWELTNNLNAIKINDLYDIFGRETFLKRYYEFILNNDTFYFNDTDKILLEITNRNTNEYVEEKLENIIFATINNFKVGIVYAEQHRSIIGHTMAEKYDIDIAIIININRSVSYRASNKNDIDVNDLALIYNGGGHKKAGGSPLPEDLLPSITKLIFKEIKIEE